MFGARLARVLAWNCTDHIAGCRCLLVKSNYIRVQQQLFHDLRHVANVGRDDERRCCDHVHRKLWCAAVHSFDSDQIDRTMQGSKRAEMVSETRLVLHRIPTRATVPGCGTHRGFGLDLMHHGDRNPRFSDAGARRIEHISMND